MHYYTPWIWKNWFLFFFNLKTWDEIKKIIVKLKQKNKSVLHSFDSFYICNVLLAIVFFKVLRKKHYEKFLYQLSEICYKGVK